MKQKNVDEMIKTIGRIEGIITYESMNITDAMKIELVKNTINELYEQLNWNKIP